MQGRGPSLAKSISCLLGTASPDKCLATNTAPQVQAEMGNPFLGTLTLWGAAQPHTASCRDTLLDLLWERVEQDNLQSFCYLFLSPKTNALQSGKRDFPKDLKEKREDAEVPV